MRPSGRRWSTTRAPCSPAITTAARSCHTSASLATRSCAPFDIWMVVPGWNWGLSNKLASIADVANHIDHVCQLAGNCRHSAIGSDLDGGYGREQSPYDIDTIADMQKLTGILAGRGYRAEDIAAIMHGN